MQQAKHTVYYRSILFRGEQTGHRVMLSIPRKMDPKTPKQVFFLGGFWFLVKSMRRKACDFPIFILLMSVILRSGQKPLTEHFAQP